MTRYKELETLTGLSRRTVWKATKDAGFPGDAAPLEQARWIKQHRGGSVSGAATSKPGAPGSAALPTGDLRSLKTAYEIKKLQQQLAEDRQKIYDEAIAEMRDAWNDCLSQWREAVESTAELTDQQKAALCKALDYAATRLHTSAT